MDIDTAILLTGLALIAFAAVMLVRGLRGGSGQRRATDPVRIPGPNAAAIQLRQQAAEAHDDGDYLGALALLDQARQAARSVATPVGGREISNVDAIESLYRFTHGDYRGSLAASRRALTMHENRQPLLHDLDVVEGHRRRTLARVLNLLGEGTEAEAEAWRSVELIRPHFEQDLARYAGELAQSVSWTAICRYAVGDLTEAARLAAEATDLACDNQAPGLVVMSVLTAQARILADVDPPAGVRTAAVALEICRARDEQPLAVGISTSRLANNLLSAQDYERALRACALADHLVRDSINTPAGRRHLAAVLSIRAGALAGLGRTDEALTSVDEVFTTLGDEASEPWNREAVTRATQARPAAP